MYIIYGLHEVGKPGEIQYVGCTKQTLAARLAEHLVAARRRSQPVSEWIQSGIAIECRTIQRTKDAQRAATIEKKWIVYYARKGSLLNMVGNPTAVFRGWRGPRSEDPDFGKEVVTNLLQYLRALPILIL